jgi:hypothetical protein
VVLLDGVLKHTAAHGKPSKKSGKSSAYPTAWAVIANDIANKLSKPRGGEQCHNRFFNLPPMLSVRCRSCARFGSALF